MISVASIDLLQLVGVDLKRKAGTRGGEYAGPCPACGGRDRLTVQPQGGEDRRGLWMCRQCHPDWTDAIGWVMWREGLDFRAACDRLDVALESRPHIPLPPPPPALEAPPADRWQEAAARWIVRCQEALYDGTNPRAHAYLESRGFTAATINEAQLGYNPVDLWIERSLWGLDGDGRIWLPRGIVIPWLHAGQIWKVSVRRPADKDGRGPYITISGSANVPYGLDDVQPGQPAVIRIHWTEPPPAAETLDGFVVFEGASGGSVLRVPYWRAATRGEPAEFTVLDATVTARRGTTVRDALLFRVVDSSGVPVRDVEVSAESLDGGTVLRISNYDAYAPGLYGITVRMGFSAGANRFRLRAGGAEFVFTITGF